MYTTPNKTIEQKIKALSNQTVDNKQTVAIKLRDLILGFVFICLLYFEAVAITNFVWSGGFDYSVSIMLFKISMYILGFILMLYIILVLFHKEFNEDIDKTTKDMKTIKEVSLYFEQKIERLSYLDKTIVKEKLKHILSDESDQTVNSIN